MMLLSSEFLIIVGFILSVVIAFRIFFASRYEIEELTKQQSQQYPYPPYYPPYQPKQVSPLEKRLAMEKQLEKLVKFIAVMIFSCFIAFILLRSSDKEEVIKSDSPDNRKQSVHLPAKTGA